MASESKVCAYCTGTFQPRRSDAKTCSNACRVALHRRTKGAPPTRRRRSSAARKRATGHGVVVDHRPVPSAARLFTPAPEGGAWTCGAANGTRWVLVELAAGGGAWALAESVPDGRARFADGEVREVFAPGAVTRGPGPMTRRGAMVWALLRIHRAAGGIAKLAN